MHPYDKGAPRKFAAVTRFLRKLLPFPVETEHVGSSAVPGLGGKRVIDMLVVCPRRRMRAVVRHLESAGYRFNPAAGAGTFADKFFVSGWFPYRGDAFHVHYHITFKGSGEHRDKLAFRDYLRRHPNVAREYYRLKKRGCVVENGEVKFVWDKEPFVAKVLKKARAEDG